MDILIKKIPEGSSLVTTTVLNTNTIEIKNKIPVVSDLVNTTDYDTKMSEIKRKYITSSDHNKFTKEVIDARMKQKESVNKSDISNFKKTSYSNTLAAKSELKVEPDKVVILQTYDLNYFLGKLLFW